MRPGSHHAVNQHEHMVMYREDDGGGDFTFAVVRPAAGGSGGGVVFLGGSRIVGATPASPLYPLFGRPRSPPTRPLVHEPTGGATTRVPLRHLLLLVDREPELAPAETTAACHCPLCPPGSPAPKTSPPRCRKSGSTGSAVLRWRQRFVGRSHSDGKEKFVFLGADASPSASDRKGRTGPEGAVGGHAWSWYAKRAAGGGCGGGGVGNGGRRRSFLPYRQDLVGLFGYATAFRRSYHPF